MFFRFAALAVLFVRAVLRAGARPRPKPRRRRCRTHASIINRHIKEVGGREAILAHKSMHMTGDAVGAGVRHHRADGDVRRRRTPIACSSR